MHLAAPVRRITVGRRPESRPESAIALTPSRSAQARHGDGRLAPAGGRPRRRRPRGSFDLDFHTIPCHGDRALVERHCVPKRSRHRKGVLAFLVRDAGTRGFAWANATVARDARNDGVLRFVEAWKARTGRSPAELVFDSRLTTYANLARLDAMGIGFLTLHRRSARLVDALPAEPPERRRRVTLTNIARRFRTPRVPEQTVRLGDCPDPVRQITVRDLGHDSRRRWSPTRPSPRRAT